MDTLEKLIETREGHRTAVVKLGAKITIERDRLRNLAVEDSSYAQLKALRIDYKDYRDMVRRSMILMFAMLDYFDAPKEVYEMVHLKKRPIIGKARRFLTDPRNSALRGFLWSIKERRINEV